MAGAIETYSMAKAANQEKLGKSAVTSLGPVTAVRNTQVRQNSAKYKLAL